jgi:hypothetical protein
MTECGRQDWPVGHFFLKPASVPIGFIDLIITIQTNSSEGISLYFAFPNMIFENASGNWVLELQSLLNSHIGLLTQVHYKISRAHEGSYRVTSFQEFV